MQLTPDMPIHARIAVIEDALAVVLDRGEQMSVESCGPSGERAVYVISARHSDFYHTIDLYILARELERLLS